MNKIIRLICALVLFAGININTVEAGQAVLTWQAPTAYTDETPMPLADIGAYNIYSGASATTMANKLTLPITTAWPSLATMGYTMTNLGPGTVYFAVSCTSVAGQEGGISNTASKEIILTPGAPGNLVIPGGVNYV